MTPGTRADLRELSMISILQMHLFLESNVFGENSSLILILTPRRWRWPILSRIAFWPACSIEIRGSCSKKYIKISCDAPSPGWEHLNSTFSASSILVKYYHRLLVKLILRHISIFGRFVEDRCYNQSKMGMYPSVELQSPYYLKY